MRSPIFVHALTDEERSELEAGLRSSKAVVLRRCQIVLASARGERVPQIAQVLGCDEKTVRQVVHGFNARGVALLQLASSRPRTIHAAFTSVDAERLRDLLHRSPRAFGKSSSLWTLQWAAEVSCAEGLTARRGSGETTPPTPRRFGGGWARAKPWITGPDPELVRKKSRPPR